MPSGIGGRPALLKPGSAEQENSSCVRVVMSEIGKFVKFQRGDGSTVACQMSRILYIAKGDHGTVINFGSGTQLNVREDFEEVLRKLEGSDASPFSRMTSG